MSDSSEFVGHYTEGKNLFAHARWQAFWNDMFSLLRGKSTELLSFDDIKTRLRLRQESYRGLQNVPLEHIVGSVGRYQDFSRDFLPRGSTSIDRWSRVYAKMSSMEGVPPIEVYKVGEVYFVRDGNHRVSVARQLGAEFIEAHVTELPTTVTLHPDMSPDELDDSAAYAAFLDEISFPAKRPHHQSLKLSERSRYPELLGHIHLHHRFKRPPLQTFADAAADWYDTVYRPAVTLIRKYEILQHLPNRTEADLFLWLVDHLREVREQYGEQAKVRTFSDALVDYLVEQHIPIPKELLTEQDQSTALVTSTQNMPAVKISTENT